jgi:hypothetical protein
VAAVGFQSDSHLLVESCLARLRADAQLDDVVVLPTIDALPEEFDIEVYDYDEDDFEADDFEADDFEQVDSSELVIVCPSVKELPSAASIVRETVKANQRATATQNPPTASTNADTQERSQKDVPTLRRMKAAMSEPVKHARWPVVLCALVATYFGVTAFIKSPLGAKPEVQHVVKASRGHITGALHATKSLVRL